MGKAHGIAGPGRRRDAFLICGTLAFLAAGAMILRAQENIPPAPSPSVTAPTPSSTEPEPKPSPPVKERFLVDRFPAEPSLPPAFTFPIEPLGFSAPSSNYLGARNSLVSLDFLDENRLLFTFRIPGLMHRDQLSNDDGAERQIRAVVLSLPKGTVEAEPTWTVHDRVRYLWPLNNGHFLLRDRNGLSEGDATLTLKPYLDFPGPLLWIELDPEQHFLVTNSDEPSAKDSKSGGFGGFRERVHCRRGRPGLGLQRSARSRDPHSSPRLGRRDAGEPRPDRRPSAHQLRGLSRESAKPRNGVDLEPPLLHGRKQDARTRRIELRAGRRISLGPGDSRDHLRAHRAKAVLWPCPPRAKRFGRRRRHRREVWPQLVVAANGSRMAWETLDTTHAIYAYAPMDAGDVKEQSVTIFDAANGDIAMVSPVSPILDAGGNVAVSPSGRRVALLNAGAIQVFDLPAPPPVRVARTAFHREIVKKRRLPRTDDPVGIRLLPLTCRSPADDPHTRGPICRNPSRCF